MYKHKTEYKSIQKKLVTAVAMVLVACIMVVSTSYAWFTLSTAPEVTGITTSVGANGNLEMALRLTENVNAIVSGIGVNYPDANNYWGNLVDLSDDSYMLKAMALQPARLNITLDPQASTYSTTTTYVETDVEYSKIGSSVYVAGAKYTDNAVVQSVTVTKMYDASGAETVNTGDAVKCDVEIVTDYESLIKAAYKLASTAYLKTPVYDTNGQLQGLDASKVINGPYNTTANGFTAIENTFGVRAVGTSSSMSPAEMALRAAKQTVSSAISDAKTAASTSLRVDSVKLANIIINEFVTDNATFTQTDVNNVKTAIVNLQMIATSLKNALDQSVIAVGVAQGETDITVETAYAELTGTKIDWRELGTLNEVLTQAYAKVASMTTTLDGALAGLPTEGLGANGTYTFAQISSAMSALMKTDGMQIIDAKTGKAYSINQLQELPITTAATILMGTPTISILSGVYCDVADLTGNYSATAAMEVDVEYSGISLKGETLEVVMATAANEKNVGGISGFYLSMVLNQLSTVKASGEEAGVTVITDIYGYAIDLAFRTNAADSSLLLQTDAKDRVDENYGEDSVTRGNGSYMEFKSGHVDFTIQQVANLMQSVRVVFLTDEGNIFGVAALDVDPTLVPVMDGENPVIYDETKHYFYKEVVEEDATVKYAMQFTAGEIVNKDGELYVRAELALYGFSVDADGILTLGDKLASDVITTLDQNIAKAVTTLVYLDGDTVENKDVAISGNSMTGSMNLQFASSAELDPMDYTFNDNRLAKPEVSFTDGNLVIKNVDNAVKYNVYYAGQLVGSIAKQEGATTTKSVTQLLASQENIPVGTELDFQVTAAPDDASVEYKESAKTNVKVVVPNPAG